MDTKTFQMKGLKTQLIASQCHLTLEEKGYSGASLRGSNLLNPHIDHLPCAFEMSIDIVT